MNDSHPRMTLREEYGRSTTAWEVKSEPVFRVHIDGCILALPFFSLTSAFFSEETQTLSLHWPIGAVIITGPAAERFLGEFCANKATCLKADGKDILSVAFAKEEQEEDSDPAPQKD